MRPGRTSAWVDNFTTSNNEWDPAAILFSFQVYAPAVLSSDVISQANIGQRNYEVYMDD